MRSQSLRHVPGSLNRAPRHEHSEVLVGYVGCACPSTSTEPPRCRPQPYWRSLQKRQARGVRSSAAHGMASSWRSTSSWGGRRAAIRRLGRPACFARAPACTVWCGRRAPGAWAAGARTTVRAPALSHRPAYCLGARGGVGPRARPGSKRGDGTALERGPSCARWPP